MPFHVVGTGAGPSATPSYRGPKPVRGPRFSGVPLLSGVGLLGLLVAVVIMIVLMGKTLDGVSPFVVGKSASQEEVPKAVIPDATMREENGGQTSGRQDDRVESKVCRYNEGILNTAANAYLAMNGIPPAGQQELLDEGLLSIQVPNFDLSRSGDTFVVTPSGPCS